MEHSLQRLFGLRKESRKSAQLRNVKCPTYSIPEELNNEFPMIQDSFSSKIMS